jgi:hypothetical protein
MLNFSLEVKESYSLDLNNNKGILYFYLPRIPNSFGVEYEVS